MQKTTLRIIEEIAKEHDLDKVLIEAVFESQFKYIKEELQKRSKFDDRKEFLTVSFQYLGKLTINNTTYSRWKKKLKRNQLANLKQQDSLEQ